MSGAYYDEPWGIWPDSAAQTRHCSSCGGALGKDCFIDPKGRCFCSTACMERYAKSVYCPWCGADMTTRDGKVVCPNGCQDKAEVAPSPIVSPPHYTAGGIETIDFIRAKLTPDEFRGYLKGSIIKYLSRANLKGAAEQDYAKASFYATMLTGEDPREVS